MTRRWFEGFTGVPLMTGGFLALALLQEPAPAVSWLHIPGWGVSMTVGALAISLSLSVITNLGLTARHLIQLLSVVLGLSGVSELVHAQNIQGVAGAGFWFLVAALTFAIWDAMRQFSIATPSEPWRGVLYQLLVPGLFGAWFLMLWELITVGFGVPRVLLPPPSLVGDAIASSVPVLAADFRQTVVRAVVPGFVIGNLAGFAIALIADRVPFLRRGLLPVGNLVSAIPIVGIAPIMVMWFGFDWQSKAAVVVIMTFFPMLVNTIAGLGSSGAMELDLMRSVGANHWQAFARVRLPNALPYIFNALKINSALALIGAIVAEFFGTPIVGIGFRISTEAGRMNMEMVWAAIALAAVSGSLFYGLLAVAERRATFWHPSFRKLSGKRL